MVQHNGQWTYSGADGVTYRAFLFPLLAAGFVLLFLAAPWSLEHKAHAVLHGLCAQRPSHSLTLGGQTLPFDARMTGIYGGFAVASGYLLARRRIWCAALPGKLTMGILALFVGTLAVDGFNSFLVDARLWYAYEPDNRLRLTTGLMTGIALAVTTCFLLAATLWRRPNLQSAAVQGPKEILLLALIQAPFAVAVTSDAGWLYGPVAIGLVLSAAAMVGALMLVIVVLLRRQECGFQSVGQLQEPASLALILAVVVMAAFAGGRFLLEHMTGAPALT